MSSVTLSDILGLEHIPGNKVTDTGPTVLWGVAPVPPLHLGYDRALRYLRELARKGMQPMILLADFHAVLSYGLDLESSRHRKTYYYTYLQHIFDGAAHYCEGVQFQTRQDYVEQLFNWQRYATLSEIKASLPSSVAKSLSVETNNISTYTYTLMQVLDPVYLKANMVIGDRGQQKIYDLGPKLTAKMIAKGYASAEYPDQLYFATASDIKGMPISQSSSASRISFHEDRDGLMNKIRALYAPPPGQPLAAGRSNALLDIFCDSVFPWLGDSSVSIARADGGIKKYVDFEDFERDSDAGLLHPQDCKAALFEALVQRLERIQDAMGSSCSSWIDFSRLR